MLNLHVKTVELHKWRIMAKLDLHSSVALTRYAVARGLTEI
jgi:DNA-binding NarL/FixJ family response regulator